jgi:hypothetical protein
MDLTKEKLNLMRMGVVLAVLLSAYVAVKIVAEVKGYNFIGGGATASNVISFDGKGEVSAVPDLATISFTLMDDEKEMKTAQDKVTAKEAAVLSFLSKSGIDKKDIKTEAYNSYPKYDYGQPCVYSSTMGIVRPCVANSPKIIGYEVSENISVKIRDIAKAGEVLKGIGSIGVSDLSGPNFSIEDEDKLKEQARKMAIRDAKEKAEALARDLGVKLVRVVNFSENGSYFPMMYGKGMAVADSAPAPAPELPTGENKITSNVTITYEIR